MLTCPRCGFENPEHAHFCSSCGSALANAASPGEERKVVSALFIDIVGSTQRGDDADPEDVRDFLRRFHEPVREHVERYGGVVEKFIGDAVLAIFGAPVSHGDDAERAVRCGLDIVAALASLNQTEPAQALSVRVAVSTGEAVVTLGRAHERGEVLATGDVLNTASRLQSAAPPGRVVVGAATYRATRRTIEYESHPAISAKGKAEPLEAWMAIAPFERPTGDRSTPAMVGREQELALLRSAFDKAGASRRPQLVVVLGPAGIGKTRLASALASYAGRSGALTLRGRCLPYAERAGYQASVQHVKQAARILQSDSPQTGRAKLQRTVSASLPSQEVADVVSYLSLFIGLGIDEPVEARQPLYYAMRRLIEGLTRTQPALFIFEDLHWGDASQFDLLAYLCRQLSDAPVTFVVVARQEMEERGPLEAGRFELTKLLLEPLSREESSRMIGRLRSALRPSSLEHLVEMAGGNPLFLEELVASVSEDPARTVLPTNVQAAIAARIDALPPEQRAVLMDASVIGQTFWKGVVTAVAGKGAAGVAGDLDALVAQGVIRRTAQSAVEGEVQYVFKHGLVRDVAYQTLTRAAKRTRHAAVAKHLEAAPGLDLGSFAAVLAHHWREAGENLKAVDYLLISGERAGAAWATEEMTAMYRSALELAGEGNHQLRTRIRMQRGLALARLTDFKASAADLQAVLAELDGRDEVEAVFALAWGMYWLEETAETLRFADLGLELAQRIGDPELVAAAHAYRGLARESSGELSESSEMYEQARQSWVPGTRVAELGMLNEHQAEHAYWSGDYESARRMAEAAYELGGQAHSVQPLLRGGAWRGLVMAAQGRTEDAVEWLDGMIARAQDIDPRWGAPALNYSSLAFRDMFMLEEARRRNQQALDLVTARGGWGMPELQAEIDLLVTDLLLGEMGRVQSSFPRLWEAAITGKAWRPWLGGCRLALVRAQLAQETEEPARTVVYARDALARAQRTSRPKYEAAAGAILGTALVATGAKPEGLALLREATAIADRVGWPTARWQHRAALGKALYATGDDAGSEIAYREAAKVIKAYASDLRHEHATVFLNAEPVREVLKTAGR